MEGMLSFFRMRYACFAASDSDVTLWFFC